MRRDNRHRIGRHRIGGRLALLTAMAATLLAAALPDRACAQGQSEDELRALTAAYNASGQELFRQLATKPGNLVFSPYSIGTAMAMALAGARGETDRQMAVVLKLHRQREEIAEANVQALSTLNGYQEVKLNVADGVMLTRNGALVSDDYADWLKTKFAAELFRNASLADVNGWVARKTDGKIDKILDRLDPDSALVLLNAIYFKAEWRSKFRTQATRPDTFNLSSSRRVQVPMMHQVGTFALVARPSYRAIRLPYLAPTIAMVVVLPDAVDGLPAVSRMLGAKELNGMLEELTDVWSERVDLALPRFKLAFKADLVPLFRQAGMRLAFDPGKADFSGITGRPAAERRLSISQIAHRAVIEVQEEGTEAAAATAVETRAGTGRPAQPQVFKVDRPFLYYVVDERTGAILFQGRVIDPR